VEVFSLHDEHAISAFIPSGNRSQYQGRGVERLMEIADEMEKPAVGDRPVSGPRIARQNAPAIGNGLGDVPLMEIARRFHRQVKLDRSLVAYEIREVDVVPCRMVVFLVSADYVGPGRGRLKRPASVVDVVGHLFGENPRRNAGDDGAF